MKFRQPATIVIASLCLGLMSTAYAADDAEAETKPAESNKSVTDHVKELGTAVKRDAKQFGATVKEQAIKVGDATKKEAIKVGHATKEQAAKVKAAIHEKTAPSAGTDTPASK